MLIHQYRVQPLVNLFLILAGFIFLASCSSSEKISSEGFNPEEYYSPPGMSAQDIVNQRLAKEGLVEANTTSEQSNFIPPRIKGPFSFKVSRKVENRPPGTQPRRPSGNIFMKLYIDNHGNLQHVQTIESSIDSDMYEAIKKSLWDATFEPGKLDGKPIKSIMLFRLRL